MKEKGLTLGAELTREARLQLGGAVPRWSGEQTDKTKGVSLKEQETSNSKEKIEPCWDSSEITEEELDVLFSCKMEL